MKQRIILILILFLISCQKNSEQPINKNKIIVSIYPLYDIIKNIAPQDEIDYLLPPYVDHHSFEPTPKEIKKLKGAKLFFSSCLGVLSINWARESASSSLAHYYYGRKSHISSYISGRLSLKNCQPSRTSLICSRSRSAITTSSLLSLPLARIFPLGSTK